MVKDANKVNINDVEDIKKPHTYVKRAVNIDHLPKIEGYNFEEKFSFDKFVNAYSTSGIQAANLGKAINITKAMVREKVPIYLSFTSNMISSGMRDIITFLVKHKKVDVLSTSAGGIEEDIIKSKTPFRVGEFEAKGEMLLEAGIGRIGNVFSANDGYAYFERFLRAVIDEFVKSGELKITPSRLCWMMGKKLEELPDYEHENSYIYWAYKNNIPVFCPGIVDGSIGDIAYFISKQNKNIVIDVLADHAKIIDYTLQQEKTGAIILGGGIAKHYILNANIFKEGFDYAVYINTNSGEDASDSGGSPEEAISWAKIKPNALRVKVHSEASIVFPILVASAFRN